MKTNTSTTNGQFKRRRSLFPFQLLLVNAILFVLFFAACDSAKSDAKHLAKKACECQSLEETGSADKQHVDNCWEEAFGMTLEMRDKYKDDPQAIEVFEKVLDQAEKECVSQK